MLRQLIPVLFLLPSLAFSNPLEDVIYKKDGSVLRGTLIEQDFEKGTYKIEINGGSVFVIQQADVSKITKEASSITSAPSAPTTPVVMASNPPVEPSFYNNPKETDGVLFVGIATRSVTIGSSNYETEYLFKGFNIAGQKNFNQHVSVYSDISVGTLSEGIRTYNWGQEQIINKSNLQDVSFSSIQASLLLSTNQYQGWQFFTGLGYFSERFESDEEDESFDGQVYHLGVGYSWQNLQLLLRANILNSNYPEDHLNNLNSSLQLGFNF